MRTEKLSPMTSRCAVLVLLGAALVGGCRREAPAPSPSPTAAVAAPTPSSRPPLVDPSRATERAPDQFRVAFETTKGRFVVEVTRAWAPNGADRFFNLVRVGYYDDVAFFRVIENFMVQFGIHGDPAVSAVWREARIPDDPVTQPNRRGTLTYATAGPGTRTTQLFVNFRDNTGLDGQGFAPFGRVIEGLSVVDSLHSGYGEGAPRGVGPEQGRAQAEGNAYLRARFPKLDFVKTARVVKP
jgi:peptidyl-prolyl cis-trans isomerase A (cyclophilin A)